MGGEAGGRCCSDEVLLSPVRRRGGDPATLSWPAEAAHELNALKATIARESGPMTVAATQGRSERSSCAFHCGGGRPHSPQGAVRRVELTQALIDRAARLDPRINAYILATPRSSPFAQGTASRARDHGRRSPRRVARHSLMAAKDVFATAGHRHHRSAFEKPYADVVPAGPDATAGRQAQSPRARSCSAKLAKRTKMRGHGRPVLRFWPWPPRAANPWGPCALFSGGLLEAVPPPRSPLG